MSNTDDKKVEEKMSLEEFLAFKLGIPNRIIEEYFYEYAQYERRIEE